MGRVLAFLRARTRCYRAGVKLGELFEHDVSGSVFMIVQRTIWHPSCSSPLFQPALIFSMVRENNDSASREWTVAVNCEGERAGRGVE